MKKLLTADDLQQLPPLYGQEGTSDPIVYVKFVLVPGRAWAWYATEFDPKEGRFFGLIHGQEEEFGYFLLEELESFSSPFRLSIVRDPHFQPIPLSQARRAR